MSENLVEQINDSEFGKDARSPYATFELPTGYLDEQNVLHKQIVLKEITGREEDILASNKMSVNARINTVISNCIVSVGTFSDNKEFMKIVKSFTSNDRFFVLIKLREISIGPTYRFHAPCPSCKNDSVRLVDLRAITVGGLADPMQRVISSTLPKSGKNVKWTIQNGFKEEKAMSAVAKTDNLLSAAILQRLEEIDGAKATLDSVKNLGMADRNFLRTEFERIEGTIDDEAQITCTDCGFEFKAEIDIANKEFFFPSLQSMS